MPLLSEALFFAHRIHSGKTKPGTDAPFIYHPLAVASLVLRYGGNEAQAEAALLHDTISEVGESELTHAFGPEVTRHALAFADPAMPEGYENRTAQEKWQIAKKAYLEKLRTLPADSLFVIACEELHESTELIHDIRYAPASVWKRFPVHSMEVFWYFKELLQTFHRELHDERYRTLVSEFGLRVRQLKEIILENRSA